MHASLPLGVQVLQNGNGLHSHTGDVLLAEALTVLVPEVPEAGPQYLHNLRQQRPSTKQGGSGRSVCAHHHIEVVGLPFEVELGYAIGVAQRTIVEWKMKK